MATDISQLTEWATLFDDAVRAAKIIATRVILNLEDIIQKAESIENDWNTA